MPTHNELLREAGIDTTDFNHYEPLGGVQTFSIPQDVLDKDAAIRKGGARFDSGKTRVDLIPADILLELGEIYRMGAEKYDATNWRKGMPWTKVYGPLQRHLLKAWVGLERDDPESGRHHIYHALWNCVALAYYMTHPEYARFDNRMDNQDFVNMSEDDRQARFNF